MIRHHPTPELLFDYAAGSLAEAPALAVATHLAFCAECRAEVERCEALGGALLEQAGAAAGPEGEALERLMARIDTEEPPPPEPHSAVDEATRRRVPSPLWPYLGHGLDALDWKRCGRNAREARLIAGDTGPRASLLNIHAGRPVPRHTHRGDEYTVVLAGSYRDGEAAYRRGDFQAADASLRHRPLADPAEDCLCLAVLDAPIRLTGPLGVLVNPFLR